jgi:ankyrin repeat protein
MAQRLRESKIKKAAKRPDLASKKLPTEERKPSQKEQNRLDANLLIAAANGLLDDARRMLKAGANIEARDKNGWTALMYAAQHGHTKTCKLLLEKGAGIKVQERLDARLLKAAGEGRTGKVGRLLKKGASIEAGDSIGWTPLMMAAYGNNMETCALLVEKGADVNAKSRESWNALMLAACWGYTEICAFLLEKGADVNASDYDGKTPLIVARENGKTETAELLKIYSMAKIMDRETAVTFISSFRECIGGA